MLYYRGGVLDHSFDGAAARVIDERIHSTKEEITGAVDVGVGEVDGDIAVGVGGRKVGIFELLAAEREMTFGLERFLRLTGWGHGGIVAIQESDVLREAKRLAQFS